MKTRIIQADDPNESSMARLTVGISSATPLIYSRPTPEIIEGIVRKQEGDVIKRGAKPPIDRYRVALGTIHFVGDNPPKTWDEVLEGKAMNPRSKKVEPIRYGFPAGGFRGAMVRCAKMNDVNMTDAKLMFKIAADWRNLVHLKTDGAPEVRMDMVDGGVAIRASLISWSAKLRIEYNLRHVTAEQILSWLRQAGSFNGIGAWRLNGKKSIGEFGAFEMPDQKVECEEPDVETADNLPKKKGHAA
jgi:hypothetical protein